MSFSGRSVATRHVSAIVTFHRERELAARTLASIERMRAHADANDIGVDLLMTLDGDDERTADIITSHAGLRDGDQLFRVDYADLSSCRNHAIARATGDFIATLDGDDLYCEAWITKAVHFVERHGRRIIAHPELMVAFGAWQAYWYQIDQTDFRFKPETLLTINYWNACALARREVFVDCPYQRSKVGESGFGFEDWHWNCETIAMDYVHRVVPGTFRLERRKSEGSLNVAHQSESALIRPSLFFDRI